MRAFMYYTLWIGCCLALCGCKQSVWKTDVCQRIDKPQDDSFYPVMHAMFVQDSKEIPRFRLSDEVQGEMAVMSDLPRWAGIPAPQSVDSPSETEQPKETTAKIEMQSSVSATKPKHSAKKPAENAISGECVDLNTATIAQLTGLPGIGQSRAEAILQSRQKKPFKRKKDITRIKGISVKSYKKMEPFLCDNSVP